MAQCLFGALALAVLTLVSVRLQVNFSVTVCLYLILIVLVSLAGNLLSSVVVSLLAAGCLDYYFVPPLYSFEMGEPLNQLSVVAFLTASGVVTILASRLHQARRAAYADMESRRRAEEALRLSEQQWHDVFENNPIMYFMVDAHGTIMAVNPFGAEQLGYKVDELVGQPVLGLFFDADREAAQTRMAQCLQQLGRSMNWELRKVRKDGVVRWVRETARAVLRGNHPVVLIACEDITEHKIAAEKIRQQENEIRQIIEFIPQHVAVLGPDRSRLYINQAALDYHGITLEQWQAAGRRTLRNPYEFFHPEDWDRFLRETEGKFSSGIPHEIEARLRRKDGAYRWFLFRYNPMRDAHGDIQRWYVAATDIEDIKQAEQRLRQSEAYLAEAQRLSHTGSWAWIPATGEIRYWSEECFRLQGFDPHAGPPRIEALYERIHPEDMAGVKEALEQGIQEKVMYEYDYRIIHPNGAIRDIHLVGHPVLSPTGELIESVGTVVDITERKRAEEDRERLRQAQDNLARVSRMTTMTELTASLAHEVNQPIAAAVTDASTCLRWLTRDSPDLDEARAAASRMLEDGKRATQIIKRIRLLFEKGPALREPVDLNEVIREMIALLHGEAIQHSIAVRAVLEEDLPRVIGDHLQLQQVLMNLMLNGMDAMKGVERTRELVISSQRAEKDQVTVSVSDSGFGLRPDDEAQIFEPFFTTKVHGTGMGLSISRSIVESHGGRLYAADNTPCGASFCLTLPVTIQA